MSQRRFISAPPTWEDLLKAMAPDASEGQREEMKNRLKMTTPSEESVLGVRDFLEDNNYDFDALRNFLGIDPSVISRPELSAIPSSRTAVPILIRVTAAAALIAAIFLGGGMFRSELRHRRMTETVFYEPGLPVFAGLGGDRLFHEMMTSFRLQESVEGLRYIDTLEQLYGQNDTLSYYAGWLHYFDKRYTDAAHRFDEVNRHDSSVYFDKSELMSAAALCLVGRKLLARTRLDGIMKKPSHRYRREAENLINDTSWW